MIKEKIAYIYVKDFECLKFKLPELIKNIRIKILKDEEDEIWVPVKNTNILILNSLGVFNEVEFKDINEDDSLDYILLFGGL